MKNTEMSFAKKATLIMNKYKRRLGDDFTKEDQLARQAMDIELNQLKAEQEMVKANQQFDQEFEDFEMATGGQIKIKPSKRGTFTAAAKKRGLGVQEFADKVMANKSEYSTAMVKKANFAKNAAKWKKEYGGSLLPKAQTGLDLNAFTEVAQYYNDPDIANLLTTGADPTIPQDFSTYPITTVGNTVTSINDVIDEEDEVVPEGTYYNPSLGGVSAIPLATSIAGNLLMRGQATPRKVDFEKVRPQEISLAAERSEARRDAELARLTGLRTARGLGLSAGATATLGTAGLADIDRVKGARIGKSYLQEELANVQSKERADRINAELAAREEMFNVAAEESARTTKEQAIQNILADVGTYFGDVQKAKRYNQLYQQIPGTTSLYEDPEQDIVDQLLFGKRPTIKQDPNKYKKYID